MKEAIEQIRGQYPDLVEDYELGCMSYKKLLEMYRILEDNKEMLNEARKRAGVKNA
jgi:hypothetical protein